MRILTLSTYPIETPTHGGQHRLSNIVRLLRAAGHDVKSAGVAGHADYNKSPLFLKYPGDAALEEFLERTALMEDWAISQLMVKSQARFRALAKLIDCSPHLILVEQPWLFNFARAYNAVHNGGRAQLFYSAQNIESALKYEIVRRSFGVHDAALDRDRVLDCERHAIRLADRVFGVSEGDLAWMAPYAKAPPILTANGVADGIASFEDIYSANALTGAKPFALFCASAHPPNIEGFFDIFGTGVGCFPPGAKLVVAGGAGEAIRNNPAFARTGGVADVLMDAGTVSDELLRGLIATAHMILLPITHGGGTNLKSAEAVWSGRHVVATSSAMRGFEQFANGRGIAITNDGPGFAREIRLAFAQPRLELTVEERDQRRVVLWENTLLGLIDEVASLGVTE